MSKFKRSRKPARPAAVRETKKRVLVVCEGITEVDYLAGMKQRLKSELIEVIKFELEFKGSVGVPTTVVNQAKSRKAKAADEAKRKEDDFLAFDTVWAVIDVDDHGDLEQAKQYARDSGVECAVSNPCFELWLLLHFREQPGMQHRDVIFDMLKKFVSGYDKRISFDDFAGGLKDAFARAKKLCDEAELDNDDGRNPTTGVWRLLTHIGVDCANKDVKKLIEDKLPSGKNFRQSRN